MMDSQTYYSNFWCGITPQGYYRRTADYFPTKNRQRLGCFAVPMVFATFLIDLRKNDTAGLAFYPPHPTYAWPFDDINVFAYSCQVAGISHQPGPTRGPAATHAGVSLSETPALADPLVIDAVDGRSLNSSSIKKLGIDLLKGYYDPFSGRTLTKGEVGCFLSHHRVWKEFYSGCCAPFFPLSHSEDYKKYFSGRDLRAFSIRPSLAYPSHYAGDAEWTSDTEFSTIWDDDSQKTTWSGSRKTLKDPRGMSHGGPVSHSFPTASRDEL
ncbi:hypothetical protein E2320_006496 [Naja naja]|nr:hypothetical protein E2320_006496 [Naja naja]